MEAKFSRSTPKVRALAKREASQHQSWDQIFTRSATKTRTTESARQRFAQTPPAMKLQPRPRLSKAKNGCPKSWSRCPEEGIGESRKTSGIHSPIREASVELGAERAAEATFTESAKRQLERLEATTRRSRCHRCCHISATSTVGRTDPPSRTSCRGERSACGTSQGEAEDLRTNACGWAAALGMYAREVNRVARSSGVGTYRIGAGADVEAVRRHPRTQESETRR